jgi:homoserine dehydrogenase
MIEAVDRRAAQAPVASIAAVLNGTCNFVLDRCAQGVTLEDALAEARQEGFAEADSQEDLSGRDASRKLRILARRAFGAEAQEVEAQVLDEAVARHAQEAVLRRMRLRQVRAPRDAPARCARR